MGIYSSLMRLQVLQEDLSKLLTICSRFANPKVQLPILANVLLKTERNKLKVCATNLETAISSSIGAKIEEEGEITTSAKTLYEIVSNLKPGQIVLDSEKESLKIKAEGFESIVSGLNSSEFPAVPEKLDSEFYEVSSKDLSGVLEKVLFAVSSDLSRPILTGVLVIFKSDALGFVSTDGFRLSQRKIKVKGPKSEVRLILPKSVLSEVSRLALVGESINFSFNKSDNQVIFGLENTIISSRVIEGNFPDFERIIPKETKLVVKLDRDEFSRCVKLSSIFARDSANVVKLEIKKDFVEISAESQSKGTQKGKVEASVDSKLEGFSETGLSIAFNYRFLEELLSVIESDQVQIEFSDSNSPALFLDEEDKEYLHIIMPIRLQG